MLHSAYRGLCVLDAKRAKGHLTEYINTASIAIPPDLISHRRLSCSGGKVCIYLCDVMQQRKLKLSQKYQKRSYWKNSPPK